MSPRSGKIDWVGESNSYARMMVVCLRDSAAFTPAPDGALRYRVDQIGTTMPSFPPPAKAGDTSSSQESAELSHRGRGPHALPGLRSDARRRRELAVDQQSRGPRPCRTGTPAVRRPHPLRAGGDRRKVGARVVINSPFRRWEGDDLHGRRPVLTSVWGNLTHRGTLW